MYTIIYAVVLVTEFEYNYNLKVPYILNQQFKLI